MNDANSGADHANEIQDKCSKPEMVRPTSMTKEVIYDEEASRLFSVSKGEMSLVLTSPDKPGLAYVVKFHGNHLIMRKILAEYRSIAINSEYIQGMLVTNFPRY